MSVTDKQMLSAGKTSKTPRIDISLKLNSMIKDFERTGVAQKYTTPRVSKDEGIETAYRIIVAAVCGYRTLFGKDCEEDVLLAARRMKMEGMEGNGTASFCEKHRIEFLGNASGFYDKHNRWIEFNDYIEEDLQPETKTKLRKLMTEPLSESDELSGDVYAFEIEGDSNCNLVFSSLSSIFSVREDDAAQDVFHIKVGRTCDVRQRIRDWSNQCKSRKFTMRGWWPNGFRDCEDESANLNELGLQGPLCPRLESLVLCELKDRALYQPHYRSKEGGTGGWVNDLGAKLAQKRGPCKGCKQVHKEIFTFLRPEGGKYVGQEWSQLVMPVIKRWGKFVNILDSVCSTPLKNGQRRERGAGRRRRRTSLSPLYSGSEVEEVTRRREPKGTPPSLDGVQEEDTGIRNSRVVSAPMDSDGVEEEDEEEENTRTSRRVESRGTSPSVGSILEEKVTWRIESGVSTPPLDSDEEDESESVEEEDDEEEEEDTRTSRRFESRSTSPPSERDSEEEAVAERGEVRFSVSHWKKGSRVNRRESTGTGSSEPIRALNAHRGGDARRRSLPSKIGSQRGRDSRESRLEDHFSSGSDLKSITRNYMRGRFIRIPDVYKYSM
ncbi:hypothetical protein SCHPADRAFT_507247 [Schizopora paradoxa]|uniref:DUF1766-domain-containing protein n=1 Tax=Schizopora paradoxa TaxID=27342 RepID=A0A0H2S0V7_9AGAM|nr:hypothetical protein SCHPADRAFT_507247 [Schizopora paradoxa]